MLPHLNLGTKLQGSRSSQVRVAPPRGFRPAGSVSQASFVNLTSVAEGNTPSRRAGLRYEDKILTRLENIFGNSLLPSPWISFHDGRSFRRCQPDALLFFPNRCVIIEIKLSHVAAAWWQLRRLYEPVVRTIFPSKRIEIVEISRAYDPAVVMPAIVSPMRDLDELRTPAPDLRMRCLSWTL